MKILLIEDEEDLRTLVAQAIERRGLAEVLQAGSAKLAVELLSGHSDIDLIISDYTLGVDTGGDIYKFEQARNSKIPFVLCSAFGPETYPEFERSTITAYIPKPEILKPILEMIERHRSGGEVIDSGPISAFLEVQIETCRKVSPLPLPVFVRLSDLKYVKVLNSGDAFGDEDERKFRAKGIPALFIRAEDASTLVNALAGKKIKISDLAGDLSTPESIQRVASIVQDAALKEDISSIAMMMKVNRVSPLKAEQAIASLAEVQKNTAEHLSRLGFSVGVQALAKASVNLAVSTLNNTKEFAAVVEHLAAKPDSYFSSHSVYLAYFSCALASQLQWTSDQTQFKLALTAMIHDVPLKDDERLARARSLDGLTPEEAIKVREHPATVAKLMRNADEILAVNIDPILLQHHEQPDGSGFPAGLTANRIAPLSSIFIVAHDLVDYLFKDPSESSVHDFLEERGEEYGVGNFRKVVQALQSLAKDVS